MALIRRKISSKKQAILIAAVAALFIVTFATAYIFLFKKPDVDLTSNLEILFGKQNDLSAPVPAESGIGALQKLNQAAGGLKKFGNWPLPLEPKGRADLFALPAEE